MNKREFLKTMGVAGAASLFSPFTFSMSEQVKRDTFRQSKNLISLSQWCFHHSIFGKSRNNYPKFIETLHTEPDRVLMGKLDPRDIVVKARELNVDYVDLVNILWFGRYKDKAWLREFNNRAQDQNVQFICLMCDELGYLGSSEKSRRTDSINQHIEWMEAAATLGCSQFRVNAYGDGSYLEQLKQNAESLNILANHAQQFGLTLLVENHGHPSSNAAWLAMLMDYSDHDNLGVYLDLDNFFMGGWHHQPQRRYDRTQGIVDLTPYAKAISAKSFNFDQVGNETAIDYRHCIDLLAQAGFEGPISAEYEGNNLSEFEGSKKTIELIKRSLQQVTAKHLSGS